MHLHIPAMAEEVIEYLKLKPGNLIVDCTIGCGGHAKRILEKIMPGGMLIGIDQDIEALRIAEQGLKQYENSCKLIHGNFRNLSLILKSINIDKVDGLLFDLGVASIHFDTPSRGFSMRYNGPLDMRMDRRNELTAEKIVNTFSYEDLEEILKNYGEEKKSRRIARLIIERRRKKPLQTTLELSKLVEAIYCKRHPLWRIHPATKTFLALRIAVNDELGALKEGLVSGIERLRGRGKMVAISFHSLEDRIVKYTFKEYQNKGLLKIVTKSPIRPTTSEVKRNPRVRSAKLRVGEKTEILK